MADRKASILRLKRGVDTMAIMTGSPTIYNPLYECMPREELMTLQLRRLKDVVARASITTCRPIAAKCAG